MLTHWALPLGAEVIAEGTRFRVYAPAANAVEVEFHTADGLQHHWLDRHDGGLFSAVISSVGHGTRYKFRLDGGQTYPDPYSRWQPDGPHGASAVVDPRRFHWQDDGWAGLDPNALVIYECHVGTYTPAGTFEALIGELPELKRLGITALELMPVAEFAGRRNWGYDGVDLYAPESVYGGPDGLKRLIDAAHGMGLGVLLDVVYNHFGPSGNYLRAYAAHYFTDRYRTPWGEALNYDGPDSEWMRQMVVQNACYWVNEYHCDGLRLDATHAIFDPSPKHITQEIAEEVRRSVAGRRGVVIIAEDGNNDVAYIRSVDKGGRGLDGVWADDFHHVLHTYLTGERDGYFVDYSGSLVELAKTIADGFLYQGQRSPYLGRPRGTKVTDEPAHSFVFCLQNHDQVGNRAFGDRIDARVDAARRLVAAAVLLLSPETPLIFMGEEFAASTPFRYFTDHDRELGRLVTAGRRQEFARFQAFSDPVRREQIPDPQDERTFLDSKLDLSERQKHASIYRCYQDLLARRRTDPVLRVPDRKNLAVAAPDPHVLVIHRWQAGAHRVLIANFGKAIILALGSPGQADSWVCRVLWSTVERHYGSSAAEQPGLLRYAELEAGVEVLRVEGVSCAPTLLRVPAATAVLVGEQHLRPLAAARFTAAPSVLAE